MKMRAQYRTQLLKHHDTATHSPKRFRLRPDIVFWLVGNLSLLGLLEPLRPLVAPSRLYTAKHEHYLREVMSLDALLEERLKRKNFSAFSKDAYRRRLEVALMLADHQELGKAPW